ncbi:E3 ubiquitin/ISG15 ligase TRIM25-like [Aulostomus maculatus]
MAQGILLDQAKFCCSICLDLLNEPVTIPCGHSYCMGCINNHLNEESQRRIFSCPQCRKTFIQRPTLVKNTMLAVIVEELKKTGVHADHCDAGPGDVACDACTGRKLKALKSCLQCLASYCQEHLQSHYQVAPLMRHKLVEATAALQEHICSRHQEVMKLFCRTDQCCICYLCSKDEHKGHDKVSTALERGEKQKELGLTRLKIQQRILNKENNARALEQEEVDFNQSADKTLRNAENTLAVMRSIFDSRVSDMMQQIRSWLKMSVGPFHKAQEKLKQEIRELERKDAELAKLSYTEDHINFLLKYPALACLGESSNPPSAKIHHGRNFDDVTAALVEASIKLQVVLSEEYAKITETVMEANVLPPHLHFEPTTREECLQYARQIALDPNTANTHLLLSEGGRKATFSKKKQNYPFHPERFLFSWQVLSKEGLTGRCYWEVEQRGRGVLVAVSYQDISRAGDFNGCVFGNNEKSWVLDCYRDSYAFKHNNIKVPIPGMWSSRVGVYLDHSAGSLSFYSVSETMSLLHRVQTTFTQPLHAGLWVSDGATAEFCRLK